MKKKTAVIGVDPYEINKSDMTDRHESLPGITYIDIVNYLINKKSAYTMEELKAVKSLDAYNQFVNGWVKDVMSMSVNNRVLVTGRVRHSQRLNDTPLKPWLIAAPDGVVESAHCDCLAGLGETCTHVGALLFFIEQAYRIATSKTVTQKKAYWLLPKSIDKVSYEEVQNIDFSSTEVKKKQLDCATNGISTNKRSVFKLPVIPEPSVDEMNVFKQNLASTGTRSAILSITKTFQEDYVPVIMRDGQLPVAFVTLKDEKYTSMEETELLKKCQSVFETLKVTEHQARNAETITKQQSNSREWHVLRAGRITASNMKSVCTASLDSPAPSTVNNVCGYSRFTNRTTQWGCTHEQIALSAYTAKVKNNHENVRIEKCGLFINPKYPHLGASPDGIVRCDCCGEGVVEVKCPFCVRDKDLKEASNQISFLCDGKLKKEHKYSYQVQTQLLVTEKDYCDFVVWTEKDISIERIEPNVNMQRTMEAKSKDFFVTVILPELLGNLFTRKRYAKSNVLGDTLSVQSNACSQAHVVASSDTDIICICQIPYDENGESVIGCDNENCPYIWLHFSCVGIKKVPAGSYYCPPCKRQRKK